MKTSQRLNDLKDVIIKYPVNGDIQRWRSGRWVNESMPSGLGGTSVHSSLSNLSYATAGHTGFAATSHSQASNTITDWGTYINQAVLTTSSPTFVNLTITSFASNWTNAGRTIADLGIVTTVDVNGGTLDGVTIGGASAGAGTFSSLLSSSTITNYTNASWALITNYSCSDTLSHNPQIVFYGMGGTYTSPTTTLSGKTIGWFSFRGHDSNATTGSKAAVAATAAADWTTISTPTAVYFSTTAMGSTTLTERFRIDPSGNIGFNTISFGTTAAKVLAVGTGTAPSTAPADVFQMYSKDIAAGEAAPHFMTEHGDIIKLYQQAHIANPTDLATCITAITSILTTLENSGQLATS